MNEADDQEIQGLPSTVHSHLQRLYRDPRYLLIGRVERFGRERIAFIEGCTMLSATGEMQGQALLNREYEVHGRPDGDRPYGKESLLDYHLASRRDGPVSLSDEEQSALRDESWQYYVRRNFSFLLGDYVQAREDAEHNLGIWNLIEQSDAPEDAKWSYLRWWPWIERDRATAQALWDVEQGNAEHAATELYRARRSIRQFEERHADRYRYPQSEEEQQSMCSQMLEHLGALVDLLAREADLQTSLEEQLDSALAADNDEEIERLRKEMIRRATEEPE
jgi:hypothetical protein